MEHRLELPYLRRARLLAVLSCHFAIALSGTACRPAPPASPPFLNANTATAYVGDAACFDCHEEQYRGYQSHGMANSMYALTSASTVEALPSEAVYHEGLDLYYRAFRAGDRFLQEEYAVDEAGDRIHSLVREMKYVVGSGSAARTYLAEAKGRLYEMPLTWYTQSEHWNFSPGYSAQPLRFDRLIPDRCMACHNSYPESVPHVTGKYESVPDGIGCERCHGPGALHVDARLANPEPAGDVDSTIVNPAHLTLDRRLDVCQQCHLHGDVSILRAGRTAFDFRPSESLDAYMALFTTESESADEIRVISHADRMKRSPCFLATQGTDAPLDCTTCHDPHQGFRELGPAYFNDTCMGCHEPEALVADVSGEYRDQHQAGTNCFSCHMPRVETEDAPHASFTDHFIRVVSRTPAPNSGNAAEGDLIAYFQRDQRGAEGRMYAGMAYVVLGRQDGDVDVVERGVTLLREALAEAADSTGEGHFNLGLALHKLGRADEAVALLEEAVRRSPDVPERLNALAQVYEATGRSPQATERLYQRALQIQPALAEVRVNYGRFLESQGKRDEALAAYQAAVEEQPWLETAHFNLGTLYLQRGALDEAQEALRQAISLAPDYTEARGNLGLLYLQRGEKNLAERTFELAVARTPDHPVALGNLGAFYLNNGRIEESVDLFRRALEQDPAYATAAANLGVAYVNLDRPQEARLAAEQALRIDPGNETAQLVLQAVR